MNRVLNKEKELWNKIQQLREEMVQITINKNLDFLDKEILSLSQNSK